MADESPVEAETLPDAPIAPERSATLRRKPGMHVVQDETPTTAGARRSTARLDQALARARQCARIADENKARDILLLDVRPATPLVDFFVIATAMTRRQANAIAIEIDHEMKKIREMKLGIEGTEEGRWILMDYGDFVVHVFNDEGRGYYGLEDVWGDAARLDWAAEGPAVSSS